MPVSNSVRTILVLILAIVGLLLWPAMPADAANFTVDRQDDLPDATPGGACDVNSGGGGQCSLRAAIQAANNSGPGPHVITLLEGTYTLTRAGGDFGNASFGDLDVTQAITINGAGAATTIIQASTASASTGIDRVFEVLETGSLTMTGVTVRHGRVVNDAGGGILNAGSLTLDRVVIGPNLARSGGGIRVEGTTTVTNSTIRDNTAPDGGGGLEVSVGGTVTSLTNVTISGNTAPNSTGGGISLPTNATVTLTNATVVNNISQIGGGGLQGSGGSLILRNTIVASNTGGTFDNCDGPITSEGFNLVFPGSGCGMSAGLNDQINVDPKLTQLGPNGGPTPTHALLAGSGAIDRGNPNVPLDGTSGRCALKDQRGIVHLSDGDLNGSAICDIGAYEFSVFRVTEETDDDDLTAGDGSCDASGAIGTQCHLRAAVQEANAIGGPHTIKLAAKPYTLTRNGTDNTALAGDLDVTTDITIVGEGAASTTVQAHQSGASSAIDRVFDVRPGGRLTIAGITVRHGRPSDGLGGGAISNNGRLTLDQVVVTASTAITGGGIAVQGPTTITNSTISLNTATAAAGGGGGLVIQAPAGTTALTNVTLSGNTAPAGDGGGLLVGVAATATLTNVTVTNNSAKATGGIRHGAGSVILRNTIVARNSPANCAGTITSERFNLVFPGSGCGIDPGLNDQVNVDPKLGTLTNNGGKTPTHALGIGSGAIDGGNPFTPLDGTDGRCAATDQRGVVRPIDGSVDNAARCDIGAFEAPKRPELLITMTHTGNFTAGQNGVYTITVRNLPAAADTEGPVSVTGTLATGMSFVSGTGTNWSCSPVGASPVCTRSVPFTPAEISTITLTVAVSQSAVPGGTSTATVSTANEFNPANNTASDPTTVIGACGPRPNVTLQVTQTGAGTGPGLLRATLTANTSSFNPANGVIKIKILKSTNAALDEVGGQNNLTTGEVSFGNVQTTSFIVRRLSPATPPRLAFTVEIEVSDVCGSWKTTVGGGPNVP